MTSESTYLSYYNTKLIRFHSALPLGSNLSRLAFYFQIQSYDLMIHIKHVCIYKMHTQRKGAYSFSLLYAQVRESCPMCERLQVLRVGTRDQQGKTQCFSNQVCVYNHFPEGSVIWKTRYIGSCRKIFIKR